MDQKLKAFYDLLRQSYGLFFEDADTAKSQVDEYLNQVLKFDEELQNISDIKFSYSKSDVIKVLTYMQKCLNERESYSGESVASILLNDINDILQYLGTIIEGIVQNSENKVDDINKLKSVFQKNYDSTLPEIRANYLYYLKDKELIEQELDNDDYRSATKMNLIGLIGDSNRAKELVNSVGIENFDYISFEFVMALCGNNPKDIQKFIRETEKNENVHIPSWTYYKLKEFISYSKGKKCPELAVDEQRKYSKMIAKNKGEKIRRLKAKILNQEFEYVLSYGTNSEIKDYYIKNINKISVLEKGRLVNALGEDTAGLLQYLMSVEDYDTLKYITDYAKLTNYKEILAKNLISVNSFASYDEIKQSGKVDFKFVEINGEVYRKEEFEKLKDEALKMLEGIPFAEKGNSKSEYEVFKSIYRKVFKETKYDKKKARKHKMNKTSTRIRSAYGCIVDKKSVCEGNAKGLKLLLGERNIESKVVYGYLRSKTRNALIKQMIKHFWHEDVGLSSTQEAVESGTIFEAPKTIMQYAGQCFHDRYGGGHSWNQVKIGNTWFNCDVTNIANEEKALFGDKEYKLDNCGYYYAKDCDKEFCDINREDFLRKMNISRRVISLKSIRERIKEILGIQK